MFVLRDYQERCVQTLLNSEDDPACDLVQLPTGAGKTVIAWSYIAAKCEPTLIVAPTRELVEQIIETGARFIPKGHIGRQKRNGYWPKYAVTTMAGALSVYRRDPNLLPKISVLVIDEAHRAQAERFRDLVEHYKGQGVRIIGLTATPERLDGKNLLDVFGRLSFRMSLLDLIQQRHLVDLRCYRVKTRMKLTQVRMSAGDISPVSLRDLDADARNEIIIKTYQENCVGKKTLIFCLNVSHASGIANELRARGVRAEAIYGTMSSGDRRRIICDFREGRLDVLANVQLLTEGFDEPSIEALILARPTKSKALYCQMVGRGVRPHPGKSHCDVYDISDEIHNICSFNALGDDSGRRLREIDESKWRDGEFLGEILARDYLTLDDVEIDVEEYFLTAESQMMGAPAFNFQMQSLSASGVFFASDITVGEASYLLFKTRMLEAYGIDSRDYWREWATAVAR